MFQIGQLQICSANNILGASEVLFSNARLTMKINVGISTEGCYKPKERDSPVERAAWKSTQRQQWTERHRLKN